MKELYYKINSYLNIIKKDLKYKFPIPFYKKMILWRNGFLAEKYVLYRMDSTPSNLFLSDHHTSLARWINDPFIDVLTNKLIFGEIVGQYISVPKIFGWIFSGIYYPKTNSSLLELLKTEEIIVIKGVTGGGGKFVFIVKLVNESILVNNKNEYTETEFLNFTSKLDNYIVTEFIKQGSFAAFLNKDSVNTMRIVTMIDPETHKPFIARAVQRIGVKNSIPMDNFTKGGLSAMIDIETGILSDATTHPNSSKHVRVSIHPESGSQIEGSIIPNWDMVKTKLLTAAENLPMLKVVGWDLVITDNDVIAIEGNHHPDPDVLQAHGPLLTNEKIVKFYKHYKILK